jgi:hypothetical protein
MPHALPVIPVMGAAASPLQIEQAGRQAYVRAACAGSFAFW